MALTGLEVRLVERGAPAILSAVEWETPGLQEACRVLGANGVLGVSRSGQYAVLEPRNFVGELKLQGHLVKIAPKNPDWFAAIRAFVGPRLAKTVKDDHESGAEGDFASRSLAAAFKKALEEALSFGLPSTYRRESMVTSRPSGRLMLTETLRELSTRGLRHLARCSKSVRTVESRIGSVLHTTSDLIQNWPDTPSSIKDQLLVLTGAVDDGGLRLGVSEAIRVADELICEYSDWEPLVRLLEVTRAILNQEDVLWDVQVSRADGQGRFCDTDKLWEVAICLTLRKLLRPNPVEHHPLRHGPQLLSLGGPAVDPDVVAFRCAKPFIIIDAKNSRATAASSGDVYQVVCYSERLDAVGGLLVYVADASWVSDLGLSKGGRRIAAIGVAGPDYVGGLEAAAGRALVLLNPPEKR